MIFHKRPINRKSNKRLLSMDLGHQRQGQNRGLQISNKDFRMSLRTGIEAGLSR